MSHVKHTQRSVKDDMIADGKALQTPTRCGRRRHAMVKDASRDGTIKDAMALGSHQTTEMTRVGQGTVFYQEVVIVTDVTKGMDSTVGTLDCLVVRQVSGFGVCIRYRQMV